MYSLDALLKDVQQKVGKLHAKEQDGGALDYAEVWQTFLRYAKSCLEQKRGLQLTSFCKIGWQTEKKLAGVTYRPVFHVTDQFCRTYCSREAQRKLAAPTGGAEECPFEEFNFSKAAIKFSQKLTKDHIFTGMKSIVKQLGEAMDEGKDLDISFGDIGKLTSKEREPRFHFSSEFAADGAEAPMDAGNFGAAFGGGGGGAAAFRRDAPSAARGLGIRGGSVGASAADDGAAAARPPPTPMPAISERAPPSPEREMYGMTSASQVDDSPPRGYTPQSSVSQINPGSSVSRTHVLTGQQFKREVAFKEAMDRHIGEMESRASEAMREKAAWSRHVEECLDQERNDIQGRRHRMLENQHFVQQQKLLNEEKRKEQRQEDIIAASAHDFPKFTEPAEADMKDFIHGQQARMRKDLDEQVRTNTTLKNLSKQRERQMEVNQLQANRAEMAMLRDAERAKKAYDKEALATAWNSDIRMKNIWKAIDNHNKVSTHGGSQVLQMDSLPPSRSGSSVRSAGRIMTGSSRRVPLGASRSMGSLAA